MKGVVRIHLVEADGLASKDNYVRGVMAGMSDPYALLRVGPQTFKSRHLDNTLNPKWDEMYEVGVKMTPHYNKNKKAVSRLISWYQCMM